MTRRAVVDGREVDVLAVGEDGVGGILVGEVRGDAVAVVAAAHLVDCAVVDVDHVLAGPTGDCVASRPTDDCVAAESAAERVVAALAFKAIGTVCSVEGLSVVVAEQGVAGGSTDDL